MSPQGEESEIEALYLFKNEDYYYLLLIGVDAVMEPNQHKCEDRTFKKHSHTLFRLKTERHASWWWYIVLGEGQTVHWSRA